MPAFSATALTLHSMWVTSFSVHDGHKIGLSDAELGSDDNLAAMCAACKSGLSNESLHLFHRAFGVKVQVTTSPRDQISSYLMPVL